MNAHEDLINICVANNYCEENSGKSAILAVPPLSLIRWLLFATGSTFAILFSEVHSGENAAFFGGSSNSHHKVLWAVGWQRDPLPLHCTHTAQKTLLSIQSAADAVAAMHSSLEREALEEIIHIKGGNAATSNTISLSLLLLPLWLYTSKYH